MGNFMNDSVICLLLLLSVSIVFGISEIIKSLTNNGEDIFKTSTYSWIIRLCLNLLGYATILLPGCLIYKYVRYTKYIQRSGKGCIPRLVHSCFMGHCETGLLDSPPYTSNASTHIQRTFTQDALLLMYCFFGLQISYLTWGYLQEKIMTQEYEDASGNKARFQDSQFLVFVNRILAFAMSGLYLLIQRQPQHKTPLYKYAFCSLSNIMSSWCQYEALKYVSFPSQVLVKASKIIPVMIMGKIISHTTYEYYEYVTAILISIGMTLFMLDSSDHKNDGATTLSGVILLGGYLLLDSFTSTRPCPLELLMKSLFKCYKAVSSADNDKAKKIITEAETVLMQIQQGQELCRTLRGIEHVFYATKCFILYDSEENDQLEEILENIINTDDFTNEELGALYGCESIIWSCLNDFGMNKAIDMAKKAIEKDEDCALWHFILGKNLRRQRRSINVSSEVSDAEKNHFEIAYAISKNEVIGIYYLQMRMESFYKFVKDRNYVIKKATNEKQVLDIAKKMVKSKPTNCKVLLKLALMFLRANVSDETLLAKECLDSIKEMAPNNSTYLHYTAMLYKKCGDYREAIKYFKKAADCNNFVAEIAYVQYGWETGELEPLPHLLRMMKKYHDHLIKERRISMLLAIAITYYSLHKDITNAAEYFLKALMIDPTNKKFKIYYKFLDFNTQNILLFLNNQFCPLLESKNLQEKSQKIKALLNLKQVTVEDIAYLSEKFRKNL